MLCLDPDASDIAKGTCVSRLLEGGAGDGIRRVALAVYTVSVRRLEHPYLSKRLEKVHMTSIRTSL